MNERRLVLKAVATAGLGTLPAAVAAQAKWPERPIRIIVPTAAAGAADLLAREFATRLSERLGQQVIVDNRPGAATVIGTTAVARAAPDGYTLLLALTGLIQNPVQMKSVPYDPIKDFTPLARIGPSATALLVRSELGLRDAKEFVAAARGKGWTYGSTAPGPQVVMEIFSKSAGLGLVHVPYKGEAPMLSDLLGGQIHTGLFSIASTRGFIQQGKVRPLAVLADTRLPTLPDVPTFVEQGFREVDWTGGWYAFMAPAGLPKDITDRLIAEIKAIYDDPVVNRRLQDMELMLNWADGYTFAPLIRRDMERWRSLIEKSGVVIEQ
ncbi:MAG: tripartite tricarboxylate transporter substrate binding protein [Burkholderiales bacterium]|jgi:tripartite-type tricarboxylate transporter receptor subunit TctC